jgi:DNA-binding PadR family transcriptional regulator
MHDRIVQNFLDLAILLELRKRSLSSHGIIDFAHKKFRILLTSGTVSTHLSTLEKDGLIKAEDSQGKRVYALTERGKETISELLSIKDKILGLFLNLLVSE